MSYADSTLPTLDPQPLDAAAVQVSILNARRLQEPGTLSVDGLLTLAELAAWIRDPQSPLKNQTGELRLTLRQHGRESGGLYQTAKARLPACIPAAHAPPGTPLAGLAAAYHNSLYGFDIDEGREILNLTALRRELQATPGCVFVATSAGGDGLYCLIAGPRAESDQDYKDKWQAISDQVLPAAASAASGGQSKNLNRLRFLAFDSEVWLADGSVIPVQVVPDARPGSPLPVQAAPLLDCLAFIEPPQEYNEWLGWLMTFKAAGLSVTDVESWSARGDSYQAGEVSSRWSGLDRPETQDEAERKIRGTAYRAGWREPRAVHQAAPRQDAPRAGAPGVVALSERQQIADVCVWWLGNFFRFDVERRSFWHWTEGNYWREVLDENEIVDPLNNERLLIAHHLQGKGQLALRDLVESHAAFERMVGNKSGEWWSRVRTLLTRPTPTPPPWEVATPGGVVDLRSGGLEPHNPAKHDTTAITKGNFRPLEAARLRAVLWQRLSVNISEDDFDQLIACLGLGLARRTTDYTSLLWLYGESGSGKSFLMHLLRDAFGRHCMGVSERLLVSRNRTDIDAALADLIEADPALITVSETAKVSPQRVLSLTGGDVETARRPHGKVISKALSGLTIAASVVAPPMPADTGLRRRLAVVHFPRSLDTQARRSRSLATEELDAVVTLAILAAMQVETEGWTPPRGNERAKADFIREADPKHEWLEGLNDTYAGKTLAALVDEYNAAYPGSPTTDRSLGRAITNSDRWEVERVGRGDSRKRRLRLRGQPSAA